MTSGRRRWHPPLAPEDLALWEQVKASVEPLRRVERARAPAKLASVEDRAPAAPKPPHPQPPRPAAPVQPAPKPAAPRQGLDKTLVRRVRRGLEPISRRLDLHGLRQDEAHRQLLAFLREAQRRGDRVVLLITGKGAGDGYGEGERGVLRRAVPRWLRLAEFHALVVGFAPAEQPHGGAGALYVHVRRARSLE